MAMLEAFVYDPLISWRLLAQDNDSATVTSSAVTNAVEKAVRQSMDAPTPTVGSPAAEIGPVRSEIESESRLKSEPPTRDNLPKLLRLKSNAMESSQDTLNSRYLSSPSSSL
jgi:phosphatidylinositol kinase/protein kinase (PI-3  family)